MPSKIAFAIALIALAGATWNTEPTPAATSGGDRSRQPVEPDPGVDAYTSRMFLDNLLTIVRLRPGRLAPQPPGERPSYPHGQVDQADDRGSPSAG